MAHRIDSSTKEVDKFGSGKHGYTEGVPGVTPATETTADAFDMFQEEICNVIEGNGVTLSKGTRNQLYTVLRSMVGESGDGTALTLTGGSANGKALIATGTGTAPAIDATGGASNGPAITANSTGTGDTITATSVDGHAIVASSDTTTPAKSALRIVPQDTDPATSPAQGDGYINSVTGKLSLHDGNSWLRYVPQAYINTSASNTISNTTTETVFDKYHTVLANTLRAGSTIRLIASGFILSHTGTPDLEFRYRIGGVTGGVMFYNDFTAVTSSDEWWIDSVTIFRTGGATAVTRGITRFGFGPQTLQTLHSDQGQNVIDTTTALDLVMTAQWSIADTQNQVQLDNMVVDIT